MRSSHLRLCLVELGLVAKNWPRSIAKGHQNLTLHKKNLPNTRTITQLTLTLTFSQLKQLVCDTKSCSRCLTLTLQKQISCGLAQVQELCLLRKGYASHVREPSAFQGTHESVNVVPTTVLTERCAGALTTVSPLEGGACGSTVYTFVYAVPAPSGSGTEYASREPNTLAKRAKFL